MNADRMMILPQARIDAARAGNFWHDRTIADYFDANLKRGSDRLAVVDNNSMTGRVTRLTYGELDDRVGRIAAGLIKLGIRCSDVISCQLPNWWQMIALHLAAVRIGVVLNPLMPIFRQRELGFMLGWAESRLLVVPEVFRGFDHAGLAEQLRRSLPALEHVLVIGKDGRGSFDALLDQSADRAELDRLVSEHRLAPDDIATIMYTSGTTGEPKGVMHTSNTIFCNLIEFSTEHHLGSSDVSFMPSPLAHLTGFLYGVMNPILIGGPVVLQDIWDPGKALDLIEREGVTFTISATPFLVDYCEAARHRPKAVETLKVFVSAGAPIPRELGRRAHDILGASIISMWGMTENGPVCYTLQEDAPEKTYETDGRVNRAMQAHIVDNNNRPLPPHTEGRLVVRGAGQFVGYLKRPDLGSTDAEGWFDTGDLARMDEDNYVRIIGRSKDVIIRGGENIPVVEIEGLLFKHPAIAEVAIVAMPDARLGERACAFVTARPGQRLAYADMVAFLRQQGCANQYIPERLEVVDALPRTPSGKIQKFQLREMVKSLSAER